MLVINTVDWTDKTLAEKRSQKENFSSSVKGEQAEVEEELLLELRPVIDWVLLQ